MAASSRARSTAFGLPDLGEQLGQAYALVGTPPGPECPDREPPRAPVGGLGGPRGELSQARGALAARQGLDVERADDGVPEQGHLPAAGLRIVLVPGHALRLARQASACSITRRGETGLGQPGQPPEREELVEEKPAERARVRRRLGLRPVEHGQGHQDLIGPQHGGGASGPERPRPPPAAATPARLRAARAGRRAPAPRPA